MVVVRGGPAADRLQSLSMRHIDLSAVAVFLLAADDRRLPKAAADSEDREAVLRSYRPKSAAVRSYPQKVSCRRREVVKSQTAATVE